MSEDLADRIVEAALGLAAETGWRRVTLAEIAEAAGVSRADLARYAPSKPAIVTELSRMIDRAALADGPPDPEEPARDRLFDLLMRRFDMMSLHREGIRAILKDLRSDPATALGQGLQLERSMRWMLEEAGIEAGGLTGALRVRALVVLYLLVLQVWETDESPDLARTMKALDERLRQAEQLENSIGRRLDPLCRRGRRGAARHAAAADAEAAETGEAAT